MLLENSNFCFVYSWWWMARARMCVCVCVCVLDYERLKFVFLIQGCQRQRTGWASKAFIGGKEEEW